MTITRADVLTYEGDVFPEEAGWERGGTFDAGRSIVGGSLTIDVDLGVWAPLPFGEQDFYTKPLDAFAGKPFFLQWRCETDAPNTEIEGVGGSALNALGGAVENHFTVSRDTVRYRRDNFIPFVFVDIAPGVRHTYRLESYTDKLYVVYIDGTIIDSGVPEASFPNPSARVIWGASMYLTPSTNEWDYIRYGTIPLDGSGDFDSDGQVDGDDFYYFDECFLGSGVDAGPGCRFADFDFDTDVDCDDWTAFTEAWTAPDDPPAFTPCAAPPPAVPTASARGCLLMCLVMLLAGGIALLRSRVCG